MPESRHEPHTPELPVPSTAQAPSPSPRAPKKGGVGRFLLRHPSLAAFTLLILLLGAFVGQNLEPTSVDFLFWTLLDVPKIVLMLLGVPLGAILWELLRRAFR